MEPFKSIRQTAVSTIEYKIVIEREVNKNRKLKKVIQLFSQKKDLKKLLVGFLITENPL